MVTGSVARPMLHLKGRNWLGLPGTSPRLNSNVTDFSDRSDADGMNESSSAATDGSSYCGGVPNYIAGSICCQPSCAR